MHSYNTLAEQNEALRAEIRSLQSTIAALCEAAEQRWDDGYQIESERRRQETIYLENLSILAGGVAHDFNNTLTGILGYAELALLDLHDAPAARASIEAIIAGAWRAAELTHLLLAYAGRGRAAMQPLELNTLIEDTAELLRARLVPQCGLQLQLGHALPPITADATSMQQILIQLLKNSAEALDGAAGTITIDTDCEHLDDHQLRGLIFSGNCAPGTYVRLSVRDSGPGIDAATLTRIFAPFFTTKFTGRGLGLAAVHGIVRSHGAALHVQSAPGNGVTFQIWFPTAPSNPDAPHHERYITAAA